MSSNRDLSRLSKTLSVLLHRRVLASHSGRALPSPVRATIPPPQSISVPVAARLAPQHTLATATAFPLPIDLVEGSVARLRWVALGFALAVVAVYVVGMHGGSHWIDPETAPSSYRVALKLAVVAGLCMSALSFTRLLSPYRLLDAALLFQVGGGLLISLAENAVPRLENEVVRGQPSLAVWIAFFVLAVPSSFGKSTLAAVVTACMGPVGLGIQVILGNVVSPPPWDWILLFATPFFMAAAASALTRFMYDLGAQVSQARDLGSYRLLECVGQGGMGEVWRARHRMLAREAAIKLIRYDTLQAVTPDQVAAAKRRFEREAKTTAALQSPHTVTLYDYGVAEDGRFYYVMELLAGLNLEVLVQRHGPLPAARAVYILLQVCDSLGEAHRQGLVHRDIKPSNVLLCRLGNSYDFAKVLDFGLVKLSTEYHTQRSSSHMIGTPTFMPPEAVEAREDLDWRADIYSFGCLAYWLLTGRLVFEEANTTAVILAHLRKQPLPPSQATENSVPPALDALVLECIEKDPSRRPQSMEIVAERLTRSDVGEAWNAHRAELWWRSYRPETG